MLKPIYIYINIYTNSFQKEVGAMGKILAIPLSQASQISCVKKVDPRWVEIALCLRWTGSLMQAQM